MTQAWSLASSNPDRQGWLKENLHRRIHSLEGAGSRVIGLIGFDPVETNSGGRWGRDGSY